MLVAPNAGNFKQLGIKFEGGKMDQCNYISFWVMILSVFKPDIDVCFNYDCQHSLQAQGLNSTTKHCPQMLNCSSIPSLDGKDKDTEVTCMVWKLFLLMQQAWAMNPYCEAWGVHFGFLEGSSKSLKLSMSQKSEGFSFYFIRLQG